LAEKQSETVYVIILSWNSGSHLEYCLPTVVNTSYPNVYFILVDNASNDGSVEFVRKQYPQILVINNKHNVGYAGGNNVGIHYALESDAKYIVFLNPDTRVDSRWISEAVRVAEQDSRIGIIGFRVFGEYMREDENGAQFEAAKAAWKEVEIKPTHHISGCALFCRAELFRTIGVFDEKFFAYGEEDDLEQRAVRAGYRMVRINVPIWHYNSASFDRVPLKASFLAMRNTMLCAIKNSSLSEICHKFLLIVSIACNPWSRANLTYSHYRRLRPSNVLVNGIIVVMAVLWNIFCLPFALRARKKGAISSKGKF
jgi:GT2 family glycosyltransferase